MCRHSAHGSTSNESSPIDLLLDQSWKGYSTCSRNILTDSYGWKPLLRLFASHYILDRDGSSLVSWSPARGPGTPLAFIALLLSLWDSAVPEQEVQSVGGRSQESMVWAQAAQIVVSSHWLVYMLRVDWTSGLTSSVVAFLRLYRPLVVLELNDWNPFASNLACGGQHSTQI